MKGKSKSLRTSPSSNKTASDDNPNPITTAARKSAPVQTRGLAKYKKAPGAPKRFKPAFIFFSAEKHREIRAQLGQHSATERSADISKLISEAWKNLSPEDRSKWDDMARQDKNRYDQEKSSYTGPWRVLKQRKTKDANAPKRPMSAFLAFANSRRADVKRLMPEAGNGEISRALSTMWKEAPNELRQIYIDEEKKKRENYLVAMAEWKTMSEEEQTQKHEAAFRLAGETPDSDSIGDDEGSDNTKVGIVGESRKDPIHASMPMGLASSDMLSDSSTQKRSSVDDSIGTRAPFYSELPQSNANHFFEISDQQQPQAPFGDSISAARFLSRGFLQPDSYSTLNNDIGRFYSSNHSSASPTPLFAAASSNPVASGNPFANQHQPSDGLMPRSILNYNPMAAPLMNEWVHTPAPNLQAHITDPYASSAAAATSSILLDSMAFLEDPLLAHGRPDYDRSRNELRREPVLDGGEGHSSLHDDWVARTRAPGLQQLLYQNQPYATATGNALGSGASIDPFASQHSQFSFNYFGLNNSNLAAATNSQHHTLHARDGLHLHPASQWNVTVNENEGDDDASSFAQVMAAMSQHASRPHQQDPSRGRYDHPGDNWGEDV